MYQPETKCTEPLQFFKYTLFYTLLVIAACTHYALRTKFTLCFLSTNQFLFYPVEFDIRINEPLSTTAFDQFHEWFDDSLHLRIQITFLVFWFKDIWHEHQWIIVDSTTQQYPQVLATTLYYHILCLVKVPFYIAIYISSYLNFLLLDMFHLKNTVYKNILFLISIRNVV